MKKILLIVLIMISYLSCHDESGKKQANIADSENVENSPINLTINDLALHFENSNLGPIMIGEQYRSIDPKHDIGGYGILDVSKNLTINLPFQTSFNFSVRKPYLEYKSSDEDTYVITSNAQIDLICSYDSRYVTTRGIKVSDTTDKILRLYGEQNKKINEATYSILEYRSKIEHPLFKEAVMAFQVEKNIVTAIAVGGIYKPIYVLTQDDFSLYYGDTKILLELNKIPPDVISIQDFDQKVYQSTSGEVFDLFVFRSNYLDFGYARKWKELIYVKAKGDIIETKRGLKVGDTTEKLFELYGDYFDSEGTHYRGFEVTSRDKEVPISELDHTTYLYFYFENGVITKIVLYNELFEVDAASKKILPE